jgi:hypothetical protein
MAPLSHTPGIGKKRCREHDCHPVKCNEIISLGANKGWSWRRVFFAADRLHLSPDGDCHVCIGLVGEPAGICIYLPPGISSAQTARGWVPTRRYLDFAPLSRRRAIR